MEDTQLPLDPDVITELDVEIKRILAEKNRVQSVGADFLQSDFNPGSFAEVIAGDLSEPNFNCDGFEQVTSVKMHKTDDQLLGADFLQSDSNEESFAEVTAGDLSEPDFNDDGFEEMTSVKMHKTDDKYSSSPSLGSTRSSSRTPRGTETPLGKSRSLCSTPRSNVCGSELKTESDFEPEWDADLPVHSDNDQSDMRNSDSKSSMHIEDSLEFGTKPESDQDCSATEDIYS